MKLQWRFISVIVPAVFLLLGGCDDSKNPLSDPQTSKADERLAGVWRERDEDGSVIYCHIGRLSEKPEGVMWVLEIKHGKGKVEPPGAWLIFPTALGGKSYLNMTEASNKRRDLLVEEKGWKLETDDYYFILKYQVEGDKLLLWSMDKDAKERAIKGGKIKGVIEKEKGKYTDRVEFTDSTENLARFVAEAGDSLFSKEPVRRLERVDVAKKP